MKNLPTLRNDSSFAVQFSISISKTRAILLFNIKIKLIEMFVLHERMPGVRSAEYQATILLKFFIIIHNYANVWHHWTGLTAGRFRHCWEEKTTRNNRMNFRLLYPGLSCSTEHKQKNIFLVKSHFLDCLFIANLGFHTPNIRPNQASNNL